MLVWRKGNIEKKLVSVLQYCGTGLDWTGPIMLIILFLVSHFNFVVCSVWWTKLATRQLFTAR